MEKSILTTIKKLLGLDADDTSFDMDVIVHINAFLMNLSQIGVGPSGGFQLPVTMRLGKTFFRATRI